MGKTCKYLKMQKFVSYNSGATWQPLEEYRKGSLIEPDSSDCGAVTSYRWFPSGTTCIGYNKWQQSIYQVSYDNGSTWANVIPFTYSATTLLEQNSEDCGYVPPTPTYRWVNSGYTCVGYDKYQQQIKQVSYDSGATWANVNPPQYSATTLIEANSSYCGYEPPTPTYRWYPSGTTCIGYNKWQQSIYQVSYDEGETWSNVNPPQYSATTLVEQNSEDCGYIAPVYRWQPSGTTCVNYDKYNRAIKQVSYDSGSTWSNVYPPEYSATTLVEHNSEDCGYVPPTPEYRIVSTAFTCVGYDKHYLDEYQVSYNGGETWQTVSSSTGSLIEANSEYCGYVPPTPEYRWVNMDISTDYECDLTVHTKYYRQKKQVSYDGGSTWADVTPPQYQRGSSAETNSVDCGYVPPTPTFDGKFKASYSTTGDIYEVECNGDLTLTSGETRVYSGASYSAMTSAIIGSCVQVIGNSAFFRCSGLTNLNSDTYGLFNIPNNITAIGDLAFYENRSFTDLYVPSSVTSIGDEPFTLCTSLSSVTADTNAVLEHKFSALGATGEYPLLKAVIGDNVTVIGASAFTNCPNLTSCTIGNSVITIGNYAFGGCRGLSSITMPNGVTSIGNSTFSGCYGLTSITIPNSVTSIGNNAFYYCTGITSCTIGSGVTNIGYEAFRYCSGLTNVTIPDSVTSIGHSAFEYCSGLTSVTIGSGVTSISNNTFANCRSLTSINIPSGVTSIGNYAFNECRSLTSITIPNGVTKIGSGAFWNCSGLTGNLLIPDSVTDIDYRSFQGCSGLTSINIPSGVTWIGDMAFANCSSLTSVTVNAITPPYLEGYSAFGRTNDCPIYVPAGSVEAYKSADNWDVWASRITAIP